MKVSFLLILLAAAPAALHAQRGGISNSNPAGAPDAGPVSVRPTPNNRTDPLANSGNSTPGTAMPVFRTAEVQPVANHPFTANVITQMERFFPDGNSETLKSRQHIARDSSGRVFQEWRMLTFSGDKKDTPLIGADYIDPVRKVHYRCIGLRRNECVTVPYAPAAGDPAAAAPTAKKLGNKKIENVDATGTRQDIPPAARNASKDTVEIWFAPELQLNLVEKHTSDTILDFTIKDIKLAEPDPKLFILPDGYSVAGAP